MKSLRQDVWRRRAKLHRLSEMPNAKELVEYGVRVEELGYDLVWVWDHICLASNQFPDR